MHDAGQTAIDDHAIIERARKNLQRALSSTETSAAPQSDFTLVGLFTMGASGNSTAPYCQRGCCLCTTPLWL